MILIFNDFAVDYSGAYLQKKTNHYKKKRLIQMQNAPSPVSLIHLNKPFYCYHLLQKSSSQASGSEQDAIDFCFLHSTGKNPGIMKSSMESTLVLSRNFYGNAGYEFASVSENLGDNRTAFYLYKLLAAQGNVAAMNALGKLYCENYGGFGLGRKEANLIAIRWHLRAIQYGSKDGYKYLAFCFRRLDRNIECGFYLLKYAQLSNSIAPFILVRSILMNCSNKTENICKKLIDIIKKKGYTFSNKSNFVPKEEIHEFCSFRKNDFSLSTIQKLNNDDKEELYSFDFAKNYQINEYSNLKEDQENYKRNGFIKRSLYPSLNKTQLFLMLMEAVTPNFGKRDLLLANQIINVIYLKNPRGFFECKLWIQKCESKLSDDLVRCGFILCLLHDYDFALGLFYKASTKGNLVGSLLVGLIISHTMNNKKAEDGYYFFGKCNMDPLALIHLGLYCNNKSYLERAAHYLNTEADSPEMYEWVGDMLSNGVKFPVLNAAATMFYSHAIIKSEEKGKDYTRIMFKLSNAHKSALFKKIDM